MVEILPMTMAIGEEMFEGMIETVEVSDNYTSVAVVPYDKRHQVLLSLLKDQCRADLRPNTIRTALYRPGTSHETQFVIN